MPRRAADDEQPRPTNPGRPSPEDPNTPLPEEQAGRYVAAAGTEPELIGQGGMGRVVAVYDTQLGREVARKELPGAALSARNSGDDHPPLEQLLAQFPSPEVRTHLETCPACRAEARLFQEAFEPEDFDAADATQRSENASSRPPSSADRFLLEARVTARLEHPSIIPVYELGRRPDGTLYYTMKRVRGRTLSQAVADCQGIEERLALLGHFVDLCQGVAYAHDKGVIHRDLKPQNVMLGEFGETVLLDWGLARILGERDLRRDDLVPLAEKMAAAPWAASQGRTVDGAVMGTLQYMSPEQARGEVESMTARSDIWSLGAVLYELIAGSPPYGASSPAVLHAYVQDGQVHDLEERCPEAPPELAAVVRRALSRKPSDRYPSAAALAADVETWRVGGRVGAYDYSAAELLHRFAAQHRRLLSVVAAAALLLLVVATASFLRVRAERDRALAAEQAMGTALRGEALRSLVLAAAQQEQAGRPSLAVPLLRAASALDASLPSGLEGWDAEAEIVRVTDRPVLSLVLPHPEPVRDLAWSADGALLATASDGLRVWDLRSGSQLEIPGNSDAQGLGFTQDGTLFAAEAQGRVRLWDAVTGAARCELAPSPGPRLLALCPSTNSLVSADLAGGLQLWDAHSCASRGQLGACAAQPSALAMSRDGRWLGAGFQDGSLELWDLSRGQRTRQLRASESPVTMVAVSDDGGAIAAGSAGVARIWRSQEDAPSIAVEHFQQRSTSALAFAPDDERLAVASLAGGIGIWGAEQEPLWSHWTTSGPTRYAAFSPDGQLLAKAGTDPRLMVIQTSDGAVIARMAGHERGLSLVRWSPDGRQLATASEDSSVRIWRRPRAHWLHELRTEGARVLDVAWSSRGDRIATAHDDGLARLWDPATGSLLHEIGTEGDGGDWENDVMVRVRFSPDGRRLACESRLILIVDADSGRTMRTLGEASISRWSQLRFSPDGRELAASRYGNPPERWQLADGSLQLAHDANDTSHPLCMALAYSPDGSVLATGFSRGVINLWDTANGAHLRSLEGWGKNVPDLVFSPSGDLLAACYTLYNQVLLWDPRTGELVRTLDGHTQSVTTVAFAPAGDLLVSGSLDGTAIVWDLGSGTPLQRLEHGSLVWRVLITPDGEGVITAGSPMEWNGDGEAEEALERARLWDLRSGRQLRVFEGHKGGVTDMEFSPQGDRVVVASLQGFARIWSTGIADSGNAFLDSGARSNLRVCRGSHRVAAVLPFPAADSAWAPPQACTEDKAEKKEREKASEL